MTRPAPAMKQIHDAYALGSAWRRCEQALRPGCGLYLTQTPPSDPYRYAAISFDWADDTNTETGTGQTMTEAMTALAITLEQRKPGMRQ